MAGYANSGSKLSVASRASQCHRISWWPIGIGFAFSALSFSFTDSLLFIESCSFVDETSPLCSLLCSTFPRPNWYVEILQRGVEGVFVAFLLATLRALSHSCSSP